MDWIELLRRAQFHGAIRLASSRHRLQWLITLLIFFFCSVAVVYVTITRFYDNPTYIVKLSTVRPPKNFPTVVVCPQVYYLDHKIDELLSNIIYPPSTNITYIRQVLPQLAAFYATDVPYDEGDLENVIKVLDFNHLDVENASLLLTATCKETILKCTWRGADANCSSLFHMELTSYGFCCVFNGRSLRRELKHPELVPRPVEKTNKNKIGVFYGLNIAIEQNETKPPVDLDLLYKWISPNNPGNMYVDVVTNGTPVPPGIEIRLGFTTKSMRLSEEARHLSPKLRKCQLGNEPLRFFPEYHRSYCILECEMKRVALKCKCALMKYPPLKNIPLCRARELACARAVAVRFGVEVCDCPIACNNENTITNHFSFPLIPGTPTYDTFYDDLDLRKVTIIRLYLQDYTKIVYARRSYFSRINLFEQLGGVFNIFFGCSILTMLEVLFLFRRWVYQLWRANQTQETWPYTR